MEGRSRRPLTPPLFVRLVRPAEPRFSNSPLSGPNTEKPRRSHFFFTDSPKALERWGEQSRGYEKSDKANLNRSRLSATAGRQTTLNRALTHGIRTYRTIVGERHYQVVEVYST